MMRVKWFLALLLAAGSLRAADCVFAAERDVAFTSGLRPGDKLFSFLCRGVTGPHKDKRLCYI